MYESSTLLSIIQLGSSPVITHHFHNVCWIYHCFVMLFIYKSQSQSLQSGKPNIFDHYIAGMCVYVFRGLLCTLCLSLSSKFICLWLRLNGPDDSNKIQTITFQMAAIFPILDVYSCIATKWTRHMGFCITYTALLMKTWR